MMLKLYLCNTRKLLYISCSWILSLFTQFTLISCPDTWLRAVIICCHIGMWYMWYVVYINVYILKTQFGAG